MIYKLNDESYEKYGIKYMCDECNAIYESLIDLKISKESTFTYGSISKDKRKEIIL